jgi:hypothetical protein
MILAPNLPPSLSGRGRGWVAPQALLFPPPTGALRAHPPLNPLPAREGK